MTNDGGPAFPFQVTRGSETVCHGMSLRDYFAGQVLGGMTADVTTATMNEHDIATYCWRIADAMLRAREEP